MPIGEETVGSIQLVTMAGGSRQATLMLTMLAIGVRAEYKASLLCRKGLGMSNRRGECPGRPAKVQISNASRRRRDCRLGWREAAKPKKSVTNVSIVVYS
jgi:hypothetical protein